MEYQLLQKSNCFRFLICPRYKKLNRFIEDILVLPLDEEIKNKTIELRKKYNIKTPDAIIAATAMNNFAVLLSNDKKLHAILELKCQSLKLIDKN